MNVALLPIDSGLDFIIKTSEVLKRGFPSISCAQAYKNFQLENYKHCIFIKCIGDIKDTLVYLSDLENRVGMNLSCLSLFGKESKQRWIDLLSKLG